MKKISYENVLLVHQLISEETGGSIGIRDENLLKISLESIYQTFDQQELYPTVIHKAARLCFSIIKNHPMMDGNKRLGVHLMLSLLTINGYDYTFTNQDLIYIGLGVADSSVTFEALLTFVLAKVTHP